ncbi:hypothetical protein [Cycloclasticus pugetii]|uniref:hypothetical protein n=1 Tax=Cycloclasticus pugetii TaxID=34068 RepID=UPI003A92450C
MRARNIKPGFWKNEDLVEVPFEYRLLFIGLWMLADREGRLEDRPKRIKMELFPADNVDVKAGLDELCRLGLLERYEAEGVNILLITKFAEHQSPHHSEKRSELPGKAAPITEQATATEGAGEVAGKANDGESTDTASEAHVAETEDLPETYGKPTVGSRNNHGRNRPDSLNPDSLNPEPINTLGTSASDAPMQSDPARTSGTEKKPPYPHEFELAWQKYPKRPGSNPKRQAFNAWKARLKEDYDPALILAGVIRYAKFCASTGKANTEFVMQAVRFFGPSCEFENEWTPPDTLPDRPRHSGFNEIDYSQGLKQEVPDGVANF